MMNGAAAPTQFLNKALQLEAFDGTIDHSELTTAAVMYNNSKKTNARLTRTLVAMIGLLFMALGLLGVMMFITVGQVDARRGDPSMVILAPDGSNETYDFNLAEIATARRSLLHTVQDGVAKPGLYSNMESLDDASAYKCLKVLKHMHAILPARSVDCAEIAAIALKDASKASTYLKQLTADSVAEAAGATALAIETATDAAALAVKIAAAAAATGPDAPQTAVIAAEAARVIGVTAAAAADTSAATAAKHAINVRGIARALIVSGAATADATPATLSGAASQAGPVATMEETNTAALRATIVRRTTEDAVAFATKASTNVELAIEASTIAATAWRHEVVLQGKAAREGAVAVAKGLDTTANVAVGAAVNVKKVAAAVSVAAKALADIAPALAKETAANVKVSTAKAIARGKTDICVNVPEDFVYRSNGGKEPTEVCDASVLGPAYASSGTCTSQLFYGSRCVPTCLDGYMLVDGSSCSAKGEFTPATCERRLP
jgi:hypothetical protein